MRRCLPSRDGRAAVIGVAVLAILGAVVAGWLWTRAPARPTEAQGRSVADAFLAAIREGRPDDAWEATTAEFKSAEGRESFRRYVAKNPALKGDVTFVSVETTTVADQPREEFVYQAADAGDASIRLLVGNEYGEWKVDSVTVE